jgi:hypothetical protein
MNRTALIISSAIVAGCVIGGCKNDESTSSQSTPASVSTPANNAANAAAQGANDAGSNDAQAKISAGFQKLHDDLTAKNIDDAAKDIKDLQNLKGLSEAQQQDLTTATGQVQTAQNALHLNPATLPANPLH